MPQNLNPIPAVPKAPLVFLSICGTCGTSNWYFSIFHFSCRDFMFLIATFAPKTVLKSIKFIITLRICIYNYKYA